jgi:hypothetical protein
VGWYLMIPPVTTLRNSDRYYRVVAKAPISEWETIGPFEWSDECNSYRISLSEDLEQRDDLSEAPNPSTGKAYQGTYTQAHQGAALYARCVASDDPRLQEK